MPSISLVDPPWSRPAQQTRQSSSASIFWTVVRSASYICVSLPSDCVSMDGFLASLCAPLERAQTRTLQRALEILGNRDRLAATLHLSISELDSYLSGAKPLPQSAYLSALEIVAGLKPAK